MSDYTSNDIVVTVNGTTVQPFDGFGTQETMEPAKHTCPRCGHTVSCNVFFTTSGGYTG